MANTEGIRLVRCPKCLNVLPEPANVTVYKCGGCGTTLRAKIRVSNGQNVATKQVRQDSEDYSVVTTGSNGVSPENNQVTSAAAMDGSCTADAPSTEHDINGTRSNEKGGVMPSKNDAMEVENTENNDHYSSEDQMECSADIIQSNSDETHTDSGEAETRTVEQCADNPDTSKARQDDATERHLNASENNMLSSERSKAAAVSIPDPEEKGAGETEHLANKKSYLIRAQSRSCDLRASGNSTDFQSARTSLQSQSFRASEPLQSKIMNTVDELKGDLSELFSKPSDTKQLRAHPPRRPTQDGRKARAAATTSAPLTAYHPGAKQSGPTSRLSRSGQVPPPPRGLPSPRYRRHRGYPSYHHSEQMEMRPCRHDCCHSCRPPCYRSCNQESAVTHHRPPVVEKKRRAPPRNHCRPVLRGAPFVICSNCLKLVELPAGFAVPSKGTRRLQCGSCSEVLSYSYRDPGRKQKPQSPFGGDEYSTDGYEIHQAADGRDAGGFHESADPVSYSEEHGLSCVSYSTSTCEDGQPLHVSRNSSFNTVDEGIGRDGKLHRLMGYSSASELLRRRRSPDLFESFDWRTPEPRTRVVDDRKGKGVWVAEGDGDGAVVKRSKARSAGLPIRGLLKKGIHGLESLKLRS